MNHSTYRIWSSKSIEKQYVNIIQRKLTSVSCCYYYNVNRIETLWLREAEQFPCVSLLFLLVNKRTYILEFLGATRSLTKVNNTKPSIVIEIQLCTYQQVAEPMFLQCSLQNKAECWRYQLISSLYNNSESRK